MIDLHMITLRPPLIWVLVGDDRRILLDQTVDELTHVGWMYPGRPQHT